MYYRKVVHMLIGISFVWLDVPFAPLTVLVAAGIGSCYIYPFAIRHSPTDLDVGITGYMLCLCAVTWLGVDKTHLLGMFLADPMGFLVGFTFPSRKWYRDKTLLGSTAVGLTSFLLLYPITYRFDWTLLVAVLVAGTEAVCGDFDNVGICVVLCLNSLFVTRFISAL